MAALNKLQLGVFGRRNARPVIPSLLNFPTGNTDKDWIDFGISQYIFSGAFYVEIDFLYSAVTSTYAGVFGTLFIPVNQSFRMLISNSTFLVSLTNNLNNSTAKASYLNTRFTVRFRRDASNNLFVSYNGGTESNVGTKAGTICVKSVSNADNTPRYLQGKVYRFDINGDEYLLTEGSGNKVYGSLGGKGTIKTSNISGITHINNDMWEAL
jgi:hypothetical protein